MKRRRVLVFIVLPPHNTGVNSINQTQAARGPRAGVCFKDARPTNQRSGAGEMKL